MWRIAILAAGVLLAAGCGSNGHKATKTTAAPHSTATRGARVVHYTLAGRDEIAVVPKNTCLPLYLGLLDIFGS